METGNNVEKQGGKGQKYRKTKQVSGLCEKTFSASSMPQLAENKTSNLALKIEYIWEYCQIWVKMGWC